MEHGAFGWIPSLAFSRCLPSLLHYGSNKNRVMVGSLSVSLIGPKETLALAKSASMYVCIRYKDRPINSWDIPTSLRIMIVANS